MEQTISIHALREEGDLLQLSSGGKEQHISIHALREEGDPRSLHSDVPQLGHFYPRPP